MESGNTLRLRPSLMVSEGSLIHCFCLLWEVPPDGGGRQRQTLFGILLQFCVWWLVHLRAPTCSPICAVWRICEVKGATGLVWHILEGVNRVIVWAVWWREERRKGEESGSTNANDMVATKVKRVSEWRTLDYFNQILPKLRIFKVYTLIIQSDLFSLALLLLTN